MTAEVLIWGMSGDVPTMAIQRELAARGAPHRFLDQRRLQRARFFFSNDAAAGRLQIGEHGVDLDTIGAVYARPNDVRALWRPSAQWAGDDEAQRAWSTNRRMYAWTEMTRALVLNRPSAAASNDSKPYQAERIRAHGFLVPPTLVTTTPQDVHDFIQHHGRVVYKSAGRTRSIATRLDASDLAHVDAVMHCPTQFQAYIAGVDWRVHVVGGSIYACEIHCTADDYRIAPEQGAALEIVAAALPEPIAARCRSLASGLGLTLAGIDLRCADQGAWYCFEVNPSPVFTYYERVARQPLTAAIVDLLMGVHRPLTSFRGGSHQ